MTAQLFHRGPDAGGIEDCGPVTLGHRRLSIIDAFAHSNQPFCDEERLHWLTFNGEIYNFLDLRVELERDGVSFRTNSDTEVVLQAYKRWGDSCVTRFNGMFAFAIWDQPAGRLFIARDRAGEKPLFIRRLSGGGVLFASEPRALRHPHFGESRPDPAGLAQYISHNYTFGERTLNVGIERVPAAHCLVFDRNGERRWRYWDLASCFANKIAYRSEDEAGEALLELLDDSVRIRMYSDVPVGAFLSGGLDSSAIVAAMAKYCRPSDVNSFAMGFTEKGFSELDQARQISDELQLNHREQILMADPASVLAGLIHAADEPLADTSVLPTYWLAKFARDYVSVVLSGDGGDELFAGYQTYIADSLHSVLSWVPNPMVRGAQSFVDRIWPVSFGKVSFDYKLRHFLAGLQLESQQAHSSWRMIFAGAELDNLVCPEWKEIMINDYQPFEDFRPHFEAVSHCHPLDQALYVDFKTWLADDILVKVDRATMAHSLECRAPFLDHRLVEFAASLPAEWKMKQFEKKYMLKLALRRRLPKWVANRPKRGFNAPVSSWFSGPALDLVQELLAEPRLGEWFLSEEVARLLKEHTRKDRDNGAKLLGLAAFSLWLQNQ